MTRPHLLATLLLISPAAAGIWAHYPLDSDFSDASENLRHGTLADVGTAGNSGIVTAAGDFKFGGGAMNFSADRDFISIPEKTFSSGTPYTIAFWARKTPGDTGGAADWDMVIGDRNNNNFFIALNDINGTGMRWRSSSNAADRQADFAAPKDYIWHHYAIVASGTSITLYLDGAHFSTATGKQTGFTLNTLGEAYTSSANFDFHGQLDEVWIFDEALAAPAVNALFRSNDINASPPSPANVERVRVILLAGQSNADGRASTSELPAELQSPQADVDFYYATEVTSGTLTTLRPGLSETLQSGPEIQLGRRLADIHASETNTRTAIIKYANGGTNLITQWKAGGNATTTGDGPDYARFQQTVSSGLAALSAAYPLATIELQSIVWMQGESDAIATSASLYQSNLTTFIADIRATYGNALPFIIGRLSSRQTAINAPHLATIRAAQDAVAAADPRTAIINTDSFGIKTDKLHFNGAGYQAMGSAFAGETAYYAWMTDVFTAADIDAGLAEPGADRDKDGQSNFQEFLGASDPLSASSSFRAWFERTGPGSGTISHPSSSSRRYTIERWNPPANTWSEILSPTAGTGEMMTRPVSAAEPLGIYRVRTALP